MQTPKIERGLLRSRVARRVFLVFLGSACLPILLFAGYSLFRVTTQLRDQADRQLHRSVKSTGMTLVERLDLASQDLRFVAESLSAAGPSGGDSPELAVLVGERLSTRLAKHFVGVKVFDPGGPERNLLGEGFPGPELDPQDWGLLAEGRPLVRSVSNQDGISRVSIVIPTASPGEALVGWVSAAFLWPEEGSATLTTVRFCLDTDGNVLFTSGIDGTIPDLAATVLNGENSGRFTWEFDGATWIGHYWRLFMKYQFEEEWIIVESAPEAEVLAPVREFRAVFALIALLAVSVALVFSSMQIRKQLVPIERLQEATWRIAEERFDEPVRIETGDEFEELGDSFNVMAAELGENLRVRRALIELGIALTAESEEKDLLRILLRGTHQILGCDGSGVAVLGADGAPDSLLVAFRDEEILAYRRDELPVELSAAGLAEAEPLAAALGRPIRASLSLPLRDHEGSQIGVLLAIDPTAGHGGEPLMAFARESAQLGHLLAAQASAALTQRRLLDGLKQLFDGLSKLIATAIDEKSPYTYGHCQRVPIVTLMLADALCRTDRGPFAGFDLSPDERYELEVAALLHDCGKVTTPVHVVDKATKLETIFDRIELVRTRLEIVARDREIERLRGANLGGPAGAGTVVGPAIDPATDPPIDRGWDPDLVDDFAFLVASNTGGEFLSREDQERIRSIGSRHRYVDADGCLRPLLADEEVENLCVARGTLNPEERQVIQDHAVSSIRMLQMLPYPKNLARVPLIAGAHHERMDGKGYPNGVRLGELPLQARILALSDVFEALTAKDRPYKDGKTLSEALRIMGFMRQEGHLDPELFDFFLTEGVYRDYAERYLEPHQIDGVEIASLPGCAHLGPEARAA